MKDSVRYFVFVVLLLTQGCDREQANRTAYRQPVDLTGEWAVEWEDAKRDYKETIYIWILDNEGVLTGSALDPNLIPATIAGKVHLGDVTFDLGPEHGRGFRPPTPPVSTFKGTLTSTNSMEGHYRVKRERGPWRAMRTSGGTNRTVLISESTKVDISLTSEEYDRLYHPASTQDLQRKESFRKGDNFEVEDTIGGLGGWIYRYRLLGDFVRIDPATHETERRLQEKILGFLNDNGYPWKSIPP